MSLSPSLRLPAPSHSRRSVSALPLPVRFAEEAVILDAAPARDWSAFNGFSLVDVADRLYVEHVELEVERFEIKPGRG